ncbi:uncharacterized protein LOC112099628 [Citrus clementina]|uniref:uncharacterized protein LOC112099628 n=1 Tax=Citrus clementina TaxID=85681 RepID=UPI000CED282A|nr:uncharacterized protein LOC112099628 [Citrus x clementina]
MRKDRSVVFQFDPEIERTIRRLRREQRNSKTVSGMNNLQDEGNLNPHGPLQLANIQEEQNEHANGRQPDESLYKAWERFKKLFRRCPHHGIPYCIQLETFYNGLNPRTRLMVDASVNGALLSKSYTEAYEILERIANNNYQWPSARQPAARGSAGVHSIDAITALLAQVTSLTNMVKAMTAAPATVKQVTKFSCVYCGEEHDFDNCPGNPASVNYQSQGQKHISQDPITSLEALIKEYIAKNEAIVQSQVVSLRKLENQMGATAMSSRTQGSLPSKTEDPRRESKEHCKVISLRFGKNVDIPVEVTKNGMKCNSAQKPTQKRSMLQQTPHQDTDLRGQTTATAEEIQPDHAEKEIVTPVATTYTSLNKHSLVPPESPESNQQFRHPPPFPQRYADRALCDLGASFNLMPLSVFKQLGVGECRPTTVTLQLADRSHAYLEGKIEDVLVKVDKFIFPVDFIVLDFETDKAQVTFNVLEAMMNPDETEDCNFLSVVDLVVADRMDRCFSNVLNKVTTFEDIEEEDVVAIQTNWMGKQQFDRHNMFIEHLNLSDKEVKNKS